jgi:hypothetical protein
MMIRCPDCKEEYDNEAHKACPFCEVVLGEEAPPTARKSAPPTMLAQDPLQEPDAPPSKDKPGKATVAKPGGPKPKPATMLASKGARPTMLADQDPLEEAPAGPMAGKGAAAPRKPGAPAAPPKKPGKPAADEPEEIDAGMLIEEEAVEAGETVEVAKSPAAEAAGETSALDLLEAEPASGRLATKKGREAEPEAAAAAVDLPEKGPAAVRRGAREEADEDDRKARKPARPSGSGKLVLTSVVMLLLGAGLCFGALLVLGMLNLSGTKDKAGARQAPPPETAEALEDRLSGLLRRGNSDEVLQQIELLPADKKNAPTVVLARSRAELSDLLGKQARGEGALNAKDPKVQDLLKRLEDVKTPQALLERITIHEYLEDWGQVRQLSEEGLKQYEQGPEAREFAERLRRAQSEIGKE